MNTPRIRKRRKTVINKVEIVQPPSQRSKTLMKRLGRALDQLPR